MKKHISRSEPRRGNALRRCFLVTYLYQRGLESGEWTTQAAAARALNVSQSELSMALRMSSLPEELLSIFADRTEVSSHTVRVIREVMARDGLETVHERIRQHVTAGIQLPAKAVLALVKGRMSEARKAAASAGREEDRPIPRSQELPMALSDRFHRGIVDGEWTSYSACSRALRISRRKISDAVAIGQLPPGVRSLFWESQLTFAVGRKLLAIERRVDTRELDARANKIRYIADKYTAGQVLRELNGENVPLGPFSRLRVKKGRGAGRLIIECDHPDFLLRYRREMETALNKVVRKIAADQEIEKHSTLFQLVEPSQRRRSGG
ncbi:hypothetical protein AB4Y32_05260 [Paraburkholderia phymatum]|uniref:Uncharacterized protein n=1 Tax=Paraburkholderia phymatum TaxID=148447 RepID=A0ACC6TVA8_9BURK